jgi:hypothetical protein
MVVPEACTALSQLPGCQARSNSIHSSAPIPLSKLVRFSLSCRDAKPAPIPFIRVTNDLTKEWWQGNGRSGGLYGSLSVAGMPSPLQFHSFLCPHSFVKACTVLSQLPGCRARSNSIHSSYQRFDKGMGAREWSFRRLVRLSLSCRDAEPAPIPFIRVTNDLTKEWGQGNGRSGGLYGSLSQLPGCQARSNSIHSSAPIPLSKLVRFSLSCRDAKPAPIPFIPLPSFLCQSLYGSLSVAGMPSPLQFHSFELPTI